MTQDINTITTEMEPFLKLQRYRCPICKQNIEQGQDLEIDTIDDKPVSVLHTECLDEVEALRAVSELSAVLTYLKKHDNTEEVPPSQLVTLNEWLKAEGIELERGDKHRLATLAAKLYEQQTGKKPRTVIRPLESGRYANKAKGYRPDHLEVLREAYEQLKVS